jgi:hypothetical protein
MVEFTDRHPDNDCQYMEPDPLTRLLTFSALSKGTGPTSAATAKHSPNWPALCHDLLVLIPVLLSSERLRHQQRTYESAKDTLVKSINETQLL